MVLTYAKRSSSQIDKERTEVAAASPICSLSRTSFSLMASLFPVRAARLTFSKRFSTVSKSLS